MAVVWIPSLLRGLTGGASQVVVEAATVREAVALLEARFPGIGERLVVDDRLRPNIALVVDGENSRRGLRHELTAESEVHFVPALSGGQDAPTTSSRLRQFLPLAAAAAVTGAAIALGVYFHDALLGLGRFGLLGIFVINLLNNATVIVPAPFGIALTCLFADVSHPIAVGVAGGLGSALGEYTGYMAGMGGNAVLPHGRIYKLLRYYMRRAGPLVIFILALVPNPLFDVGGLLAGALRMPRRVFLAATIAGKVLRYILIAYGCAGGLPFLFALPAAR